MLAPVEPLGSAGGFSGAQFWRYAAARGPLCLRRWPQEHPTVERLQFIQAVIWHVHQEGFLQAPLPLETRRHAGFVEHAGHLWELTPWMPGRADFHAHPSDVRLQAALATLARFHRAAASFPLPDTGPAPSPGILERLQRLQSLLTGGADRLAAAARAACGPEYDGNPKAQGVYSLGFAPQLADRAAKLLALFPRAAPRVLAELDAAARLAVPLAPCLRDIWHDHVLFDGERVTALVDFGTLRTETVAGDIARLLGSMVGDDANAWRLGQDAYEAVRPLSADERQLLAAFDRSGVLMSGLSWLQWVFVEGRQFEHGEAILARVDANLSRLARLAGS
jgi:homoserine kinase type II